MTSLIAEPHQLSGQCVARRYQVYKYLIYHSSFSLFLAHDLLENKTVNLICFSPGLHLEYPKAFSHLQAQALRMQLLHHPCSLQILASGEEHDIFFLVEEQPKGQCLAEVIKGKKANKAPFQLEELLIIFQLLSRTMEDVHRFMIHGFLNPQDIYLEPWAQGPIPFFPKIARLGLRARLGTTPLAFKGLDTKTSCYAAPEFGTEQPLEKQADVYGLGALLYSLLTLQPPTGCFIRPSSIHSTLQKEFDHVLIRATEEDPNQRHPSIDALSADLKRLGGLKKLWDETEGILRRFFEEKQKEPLAFFPIERGPAPAVKNKGLAEAPLLKETPLPEKSASAEHSDSMENIEPPPIPVDAEDDSLSKETPLQEKPTSFKEDGRILKQQRPLKGIKDEVPFLIEGPGRAFCLVCILVLNAWLFGLAAKESTSQNNAVDADVKSFTKWEQLFFDLETQQYPRDKDAQ